jgi:hypothetical protein
LNGVLQDKLVLPIQPATGDISSMTTVEDIEKAIAKLSAPELDRLRDWFEEFQAARFDTKIERDANAGKLDRLAEQALMQHHKKRRPLPASS